MASKIFPMMDKLQEICDTIHPHSAENVRHICVGTIGITKKISYGSIEEPSNVGEAAKHI